VVARAAGATGDQVDQVAREIAALGDVKPERAREILLRLREEARAIAAGDGASVRSPDVVDFRSISDGRS